MAAAADSVARPAWEELRSRLIPDDAQDRWDDGELPRAVLHLDDHAVLETCESLLKLACVEQRSLDVARRSKAVALREVLVELLPATLDHPYSAALRSLAGLEPGSAGRTRDERQRLAGDRLGPPRHGATPRTVRRRVKAECWPWLFDRLVELETSDRRRLHASPGFHPALATWPADVQGLENALSDNARDADAIMVWLPFALDGRLVVMPVRISRRSVLKAGGAALLAPLADLVDFTDHERVSSVVAGHSRPDSASVEHFESLLAHLRRLDDAMGPRRLHGTVQSTLDVVDSLCDSARPPIKQALLSVSAQYEQLNAWMWVDRGEPAIAATRHDRALARAVESGDQPLAGYLLVCKAKQALEDRDPVTAIALADQAQGGRWPLSPAVEAHAAEVEARAWAIKGESGNCKQRLDKAERLLAKTADQGRSDEPPWIYYFGEERLPAHQGVCYTRLGESDAAISVFDQAIANLPKEFLRDRAWYLFWSAKAFTHARDPERAATMAREAAQIAIDAGSDSVLKETRVLHGHLEKSGDVPAVRELGELLSSAGGLALN